MAKIVTVFDRPCIPADGVAMGAHTPGMHPNRALAGGRRNGLGARILLKNVTVPFSR